MENPEFVTGIPLLLLGLFGAFIAVVLFALPERAPAARVRVRHAGHPEPAQYVIVGLTLGFITVVEVALYYVSDLNFKVMVTTLLFLSALKFFIVVGFFMHLRFDSRVFSVLFFGGLSLAIAIFTVAIATLQAGLV